MPACSGSLYFSCPWVHLLYGSFLHSSFIRSSWFIHASLLHLIGGWPACWQRCFWPTWLVVPSLPSSSQVLKEGPDCCKCQIPAVSHTWATCCWFHMVCSLLLKIITPSSKIEFPTLASTDFACRSPSTGRGMMILYLQGLRENLTDRFFLIFDTVHTVCWLLPTASLLGNKPTTNIHLLQARTPSLPSSASVGGPSPPQTWRFALSWSSELRPLMCLHPAGAGDHVL